MAVNASGRIQAPTQLISAALRGTEDGKETGWPTTIGATGR